MACGVGQRVLTLFVTGRGVAKLRPLRSGPWVPLCPWRGLHTSVVCGSRLKAYTAVDPFPPLAADTLRIYSMRFCPYAQRARLVAAHKGLSFEEVNINLKDKPSWFVEKNPAGTVPVVQQDSQVVLESVICMEYLDGLTTDQRLLPADPYKRAQVQMAMTWLDKVPGKYYKVMNSDSEGKEEAVQGLQKELNNLEEKLTEPFFCGPNPTLADFFVWPFFERIPLLDVMKATDVMPTSRYPRLTSWVTSLRATPGVKGTYLAPEVHRAYTETSTSGSPDYDLGLEVKPS